MKGNLPVRAAAMVLAALCGVAGDIAAQQPAPAPPGAPLDLRFDIDRIVVEGNTLIPLQDVERLVAPFQGPRRDFGDLQRALEALEREYARRGYSAVQIYLPEHALEKGTVRLRVIEARLRNVEVRGNKFFDEANVRASLPTLRAGQSPNADEISTNLKIANESPAKQTTVLLRAGQKEGEIDAVVDVADEDPSRWFVSLDNTGSKPTGWLRAGVGYQNANVGGRDHNLILQFITSEKPKHVQIYSFGYHLPLYAHGASLDFIAGYSDVDIGTTTTTAGPLQFTGKGTVLGIRYNRHLPRRTGYDHRLVLGLDHRAYRNACNLVDFPGAGCGAAGATYSVMPASVLYSGTFTLQRAQLGFFGSLARNIPMGSNGGAAALSSSSAQRPGARAGADSEYTVMRLGATLNAAMESDWQTRLNVHGQHAPRPLVPAEQFGAGGQNSVRGFGEREVASDRGYVANFELYTPNLAGHLGWQGWTFRLLGFYDMARVWRVDPQPGDQAREAISSYGLGARASLSKQLSLRADFAKVAQPGGGRPLGGERLGFALVWSIY